MSNDKSGSDSIQVEAHAGFDREWRDEKWNGKTLSNAANDTSFEDQQMPVLEAIKKNPMAIVWCLVISTCVIMEGYDTSLINNLFAFHSFQRKFGRYVGVSSTAPSGYQLEASWQAGLGQAAGAGSFIGTILVGYIVAIFGQKRVILGALVMMTLCIFITFFAPNVQVLLVGQVFCGFPWAVFAVTAPAYASEVLPSCLRGYFTSYTNMCFIIGQLIAAGVLSGLSSRQDEWAHRIPFAIQWIWPCFLIPAIWFAPESPWHLVRHNRVEEAEQSLRRLQKESAGVDTKKTLATIIYTNNLEEELSVGTTYWDCFKGFELRRTEIACMCFCGQILSGLNFAYNSTYFFEQVGLETSFIYRLNVGGTALALVGTLCNWFIFMPRVGRRKIYIWGMGTMSAILMVIGILNVWSSQDNIGLTQAALTLVWTFVFQLSAGQLGWALPAEVGSTRLRQKTICLARNAYYLVGVIAGTLQPYFINPTAWNLRGYTGFIWGSTAFLMFIWAYFRLPETKDRSFHELDLLFAKKVSARKFAKTQVDAFDERDTAEVAAKYDTPAASRRPSMVPSITAALAKNGKDEAFNAQRRASTTQTGSRRPSIADAVTAYTERR